MVSRTQTIPPDQAWFWSERWQRMEKAVQTELDSGEVVAFDTLEDALTALDQLAASHDAED
jgi:hypothetical protein